jgi:hypothetical protein
MYRPFWAFCANRRVWALGANLATAIVTPLALIATVLTLIITSSNTSKQLSLSSRQLELTTQAFQGDMFYRALKDSREVANLYHDGKAHEQDIYAIMQSIFLENSIGEFNEIGRLFNADNCTTMADQHLRNAWIAENKKRYSPEFIGYMEKIINDKDGICGGLK